MSLREGNRRGTLVVPDESRWMPQRIAADPTSGSLRALEGHACRARRSGMDHPTWCNGRDERVPPRGGRDTLFLLPKPRAESNLDFLHFAPGESVK